MGKSRRVAIVGGVRTPFTKRGGALSRLSALELGVRVTAELLQRAGITPPLVEQVVFGQVIQSPGVHNIAREIVLGAGLSPSVEAYTVSRACASGYQAIASVAEAILAGTIDCGVAGGTESTSNVALSLDPRVSATIGRASRARPMARQLAALAELRPGDLLPQGPPLKERSTGLTMGESAEKMAKENGIARLDQDRFAHLSHTRATAGWSDGRLLGEVMPLYLQPEASVVDRDGSVRGDSKLSAYARLAPVFDPVHGTITAGNSSPLSDGAAALLLTSEELAREEGLEVLGLLRGHAFVGLDPADQLLLGAAYAIPQALARAKLRWKQVEILDLHEAFAAQVLSSTQALESETFARNKLGLSKALGSIDPERLNVLGGSLAMGHPFAATGIRQVLQTMNELNRRGDRLAICATCAAGGLGAAMILEAA